MKIFLTFAVLVAAAAAVLEPGVAVVDAIFQPEVVAMDVMFQPEVAAMNVMYQPEVAAMDVMFQPEVAAMDVMFQPEMAAVDAMLQPRDLEQVPEGRLINSAIRRTIENFLRSIRENGWDPKVIDEFNRVYKVPFVEHAYLEVVKGRIDLEGLSNVKINRVDYSVLLQRLIIDMSWPSIRLTLDETKLALLVGDETYEAGIEGSIDVRDFRFITQMRVSIGIGGVNIRSVEVNITPPTIVSDLKIKVLGHDISEPFNKIFGEVIPAYLLKHREEMNNFVRDLILHFVS